MLVADRVLHSRYLLRNEQGKVIESVDQLFQRVSKAVSRFEKDRTYEEKFLELVLSRKFLPNSPTLMNAGKPKGQLSACFVLPIDDNLQSVFSTLRDAVVIHKTGGGTGFDFSNLRPSGDLISGSGGRAAGPLAFLKIFDQTTGTVKQGGVRRGANMAILAVDHPDIEEFVASKIDGDVENFNISVSVSDAFMSAVSKNQQWTLINPRTKNEVRKVSARKIWKSIADAAWLCGDPGVIFIDEINRFNPTPFLGPMKSTNPCGELPLLSYESCNLGSMNLYAYVRGNDLNWYALENDIRLAIRFLDNVIETNHYPLREIEVITKANRKIGLGVMGWADVLLEWGIPYDSDEAVARASAVMKRISETAVAATIDLARERGPFEAFEKSIWSTLGSKPRRNATVTTIAPTGTISIIAGVSSGIEPLFALAYERTALEGEKLVFVHPKLASTIPQKLHKKVLKTGSVSGLKELSVGQRRVFKSAPEIDPIFHVRMQAAFQAHTENAVSKTINLPKSTSAAQVQKIYEKAFALKCKGITVFRDGSKAQQVLRQGVRSF